ncbi:uncharacterized protein LOC135079191 [Ostrinia nubilalis]|uniref:uncharacterized protein LOC135079191 n=1 Tax=Ostrinia nubilalis TaxID=29057 RepID=UPI0030822E68
MPKRSAQEKLKRYKRKIRKIQEEESKKRRLRRVFDSSDDENVTDLDQSESFGLMDGQTEAPISMPECQPDEPDEPPPASPTPKLSESADGAQPEDSQVPNTSPTEVTPEPEQTLDPELLSALGASTSDTPEFGEAIHDSLATLWLPLLRKGLPKDEKDKLVKDHLIPSNCRLLQSPKLNPEISAAVSEIVRGRDKKLAGFQQTLGIGISAMNRAMDILLKSDDKIKSLKYLSDSCRLLSDLHHSFTKDRVKLVTPSLEKSVLHVIHDAERDDTLFGSSLGEKIKACKAIEKQGQQIRKVGYQAKQNAAPQPSTSRPVHQGNWTGPPRYPSNRGGRGGQQRPAPKVVRRTYPSTTTQQTPSKNFNQSKNRANAQQ